VRRKLEDVVAKPTKREIELKKLAEKCLAYMKRESVAKASRGAPAPVFPLHHLMMKIDAPDGFVERWDLSAAIFSVMRLSVEMGLVARDRCSDCWKYVGPEVKKAREDHEKKVKAREKRIRTHCRKLGVKPDFYSDWRDVVCVPSPVFLTLEKGGGR